MTLTEAIQVFWPLIVFQFALSVSALISIMRRGETQKLPKVAWVLIVIFVNIFGPIAYFIVGRGELKRNELYRD